METRNRPLPPSALAAAMVQELKLERLRELRAMSGGKTLGSIEKDARRVLDLHCELEALEVIEAAVSIVQQGRAA